MPDHETAGPTKSYELEFDGGNCDITALLAGSPLGAGSPKRLCTSMTEEDFNGLGVDRRITHHMYAVGTSYEGHSTRIPARDAIADSAGATAHSKTINALRSQSGEPVLSVEDVFQIAHTLDTIGLDALEFLLGLHEDWREPAFEAEDDEVARIAAAKDLTLADFCK